MNKVIEITIRNKVARIASSPIIVGKNKDYIVRFDFDEDWDKYDTKTARFSQDGEYQDIIFAGNECSMPALDGGKVVEVGVYAGNISTTAPAYLKVHKSIIDDDGVPADPTPDVYAQLMERFNAMEAPAAVLYTAQELTDEQKAQARANVGAMDQYRGLTPFVAGIQHPVYVEYGYLKPIPTDASAEVVKAYTHISTCVYLLSPQKMGIPSPLSIGNEEGKGVMDSFITLHDAGLIPDNLNLCSDVDKSSRWIFEYITKTGEAALTVVDNIGLRQARAVKKLSDGTYTYSGYNIAKLSYASDGKRLQLPQTEMQAEPTADMHIANKKYVDEKAVGGGDTSLGLTSAAVGQLIKIKAVDADGKPTAWEPVDDRLPNTSPSDEGQTLVVKQIGEFEYGYGFARIPNISDFINLGITDASPGKLAKVKLVDDFGQPTAWEAVDMPSGGEREWIKIGEVTNAEDTAGPFYMKFTKDINGNSLSLKGVIIIGTPLFSDTNTHPCVLKCNDFPYSSGANFFLYRSILRNKQTFVIYSEFLRCDGVNSVVVTVSNSGNVKQNGGAESFINTWSPTKEESLQFPMRGIDFGVLDSGLLAGSKFEFWGVKA